MGIHLDAQNLEMRSQIQDLDVLRTNTLKVRPGKRISSRKAPGVALLDGIIRVAVAWEGVGVLT